MSLVGGKKWRVDYARNEEREKSTLNHHRGIKVQQLNGRGKTRGGGKEQHKQSCVAGQTGGLCESNKKGSSLDAVQGGNTKGKER